jgi:hypothetical protein
MAVEKILERGGPRRLLAIDAGGVRSFISLAVLSEIEQQLERRHTANTRFVLADYFDYIGGSGTGAIIAACLALGFEVSRITDFFMKSSDMFDLRRWAQMFTYRAQDAKLERSMRELVGADTSLGDGHFRTLLMLVMRNATTHAPWSLTNNPRSKYNEPSRVDANFRLPLWQLLRASCPAPLYFPPEVIEVGRRALVIADGGSTIHGNPALQLFVMATAAPYRLAWQTGTEKMLLVSVGSGSASSAGGYFGGDELSHSVGTFNAVPNELLRSSVSYQDLLCRVFGDVVYGDAIDREVGGMISPDDAAQRKLFTYLRYDANLTSPGLAGLGIPGVDPGDVQPLHGLEHIGELLDVGRAIANRVSPVHFDHFDLDVE